MRDFRVAGLTVSVGENEILRGIDLAVKPGEVHAVMGPNGSGKSTLAHAIMGDPRYRVTGGDITLDGTSLLPLRVDERARKGVFLAFQYPMEVPGVTLSNLLWTAVSTGPGGKKPEMGEFEEALKRSMARLKMDPAFAARGVNEGFSGGEKKRAEVLQMELLEPELVILDEPDSGLDVDAMRLVARNVNAYAKRHPGTGIIVITHYNRILNSIRPDRVHIIVKGVVARSGNQTLAKEVEAKGYEFITAGDGTEAA